MATKTTKYGRLMTFKLNTVQIENIRGKGLSQSRDTRETTTTDSADDEESVPTIKRRTIPFDGLLSDAATSGAGYIALQGFYDNGTTIAWEQAGPNGGDKKWSGSGHITKLDFDEPYDNNVTFTGELKVTGPVTFGTV